MRLQQPVAVEAGVETICLAPTPLLGESCFPLGLGIDNPRDSLRTLTGASTVVGMRDVTWKALVASDATARHVPCSSTGDGRFHSHSASHGMPGASSNDACDTICNLH